VIGAAPSSQRNRDPDLLRGAGHPRHVVKTLPEISLEERIDLRSTITGSHGKQRDLGL
jgi:hypothetical protein